MGILRYLGKIFNYIALSSAFVNEVEEIWGGLVVRVIMTFIEEVLVIRKKENSDRGKK